MEGALQTRTLDRFTFKAGARTGPYRVVDGLGNIVGSVKGHPSLRMHASITDNNGMVFLEGRSPEAFGENSHTATIVDGFGAVLGSVSKAVGAHQFRDRWIVRNPVGEAVAVVEEQGRFAALFASWHWPAGRRYSVNRPILGADGTVEPGASIGTARRSLLARRWRVSANADPARDIDRRFVLVTFAVMASDQAF